jgi:hypothetical protein
MDHTEVLPFLSTQLYQFPTLQNLSRSLLLSLNKNHGGLQLSGNCTLFFTNTSYLMIALTPLRRTCGPDHPAKFKGKSPLTTPQRIGKSKSRLIKNLSAKIKRPIKIKNSLRILNFYRSSAS